MTIPNLGMFLIRERAMTSMDRDLKPCPCGKVPTALILDCQRQAKYGYAMGDCCNEWLIEFRNQYTTNSETTMARAVEGWNDTPRASDGDRQ